MGGSRALIPAERIERSVPSGEALDLALRYRCVGADAVRHLLHRMETTWQPPLPLDTVPQELNLKVPMRDLSQYNLLLGRA